MSVLLRLALCLAVITACGSAPAWAEPQITWRVENAFRLFSDPADTEVHRATFLSLSAEELRAPVLSAERALSQRHSDGWAASMFRHACWSQVRNRYVCKDSPDYIKPESHTILAEIEGVEDRNVECTWLTAPHGGTVLRGTAVRQPCLEPVKLEVPYPDGAGVTVEIGGLEVASTDVKVTDLFIVGMGDSFASGEGNPDLPVRFSRERSADYGAASKGADLTGYPARVGPWKQIGDRPFINENARWLDQACHRSLYSHQLRAALQLSLEDPHRAVTFVGVACSGAEVAAGLFLRYKGNEWVPNPPDLSQISAIAQAQCGSKEAEPQDLPEAYHMNGAVPDLKGGLVLRKCGADDARKIDILMVSIGGNDIGFARMVANAVLADKSLLKKLGGWFGEVHGQAEAARQIEGLEERYKSLNRAIHNILHVPWSEADRVILTAYPGMALLGDGSLICPDGRAGMEVLPDFRLSEEKARDGTWVADKLQRRMADSAATHGWSFAEGHRPKFIGRGICAGYSDNAFTVADDLRLPRKTESGWQPYNPADFKAYASRQRWFRTPNDAFMTANFHVSASVLQKVLKLEALAWFQLLLASTYSGSFHPTAEGQAAIADAVVETARAVLERHGQGVKTLAGR